MMAGVFLALDLAMRVLRVKTCSTTDKDERQTNGTCPSAKLLNPLNLEDR